MALPPVPSKDPARWPGSSPPTWIGLGALLAVTVQILVTGGWRFFSKTRRTAVKNGDSMYGLDHGKLNLVLPPQTMWMNMGFWRDVDPDDFTGACRALLFALLDQAGLLDTQTQAVSQSRTFRKELDRISVLDVGFGCGDQTLAVADAAAGTNLQYLGITLNRAQFKCAQQRVLPKPSSSLSNHNKARNISLVLGDAADPDSWPPSCLEKAAALSTTDAQPQITTATILLALDTLYHFSPSRLPLLTYAAKTLKADLAAFDILLSPTATPSQALKLRLVGRLSGCPWSAFKTEQEYRDMLIAAGYSGESIVITDITEHVFSPLSGFMEKQEARLEGIGLKMGSLRVAGWLFGWWARSKVVRGVVVTAKSA